MWGGFSGSNRVRKPWCVGSESLGTGFKLSAKASACWARKPRRPNRVRKPQHAGRESSGSWARKCRRSPQAQASSPPLVQVTTRPLAAEADGEAGFFQGWLVVSSPPSCR